MRNSRFYPKTQGARDLWLLVILIVPLAIAGVIWGIVGDFSQPRDPATSTPISTPATPEATPTAWLIVDLT